MTSDGLTVREAVERLGVGRASVDRWCRSGKLKAAQRGLRWIVGADAFEALATERARWISHADAARLLGAPASTVTAAVRRGELSTRGAQRSRPSP